MIKQQQVFPTMQMDLKSSFPEFCRQIHSNPSLPVTSSAIAVEFQRLFQFHRTWVFSLSGSRAKLQAVAGIPEFQRRAAVVTKLETLVTLVSRSSEPFRWLVGIETETLTPAFRQALDQYLDESHIVELRIEPLLLPDSPQTAGPSPDETRPVAVVVCERFKPEATAVDETMWLAASQQAAIAFQNASDWSHAPVASFLRTWYHKRRWSVAVIWTMVVALVVSALALTAFVPIQFTIEAIGEIRPVERRHVFATSAGIVRFLNVTTGSEVSDGTLLLELDSPELEMEARRTEGELQTTEQRILAIEASRLNFGAPSADSNQQINSLAADLKEQIQRRDNLKRELELLALRQKELAVTSPIKGRVVTWDVERLLSHRPVTRGQRLLTVSNTDGPWELELRVHDEDTGDLHAAMKNDSTISIDFVAVTMPERVFSTKLGSISDTLEVRSAGEPPTLLCKAELPEGTIGSTVEGLSVRGRVQCGSRPAYKVFFTKFWRVIEERLFFPWGW